MVRYVVILGVVVLILGVFAYYAFNIMESTRLVREHIVVENRRTAFLLESYELNRGVALTLEDGVLGAVESGVLGGIFRGKLGYGLTEGDILYAIERVREDIVSTFLDGGVVSLDDADIDVLYLLRESGNMEQFFVIRHSNMRIYKISLMWMGGVCYDVEVHITN